MAWAEVLGACDLFIGVNSLDYSGYPDCRPEYVESFERMANMATRAAVDGHRLVIHAPLIRMTKREIIELGLDARRGLQRNHELLRSRARRRGVRSLRCLPVAPEGLCRSGSDRSGSLCGGRPWLMYTVQRNLLHAPG